MKMELLIQKGWIRRTLSVLLAMVLAITLIPRTAFADDAVSSDTGGDITVFIDFEGYNLGQGFYIEPLKVVVPQGSTVGDVVGNLFAERGIEAHIGFDNNYVSGIRDMDKGTVSIPSYITENGGPSTDAAKAHGNADDYLSEFDYSTMSGWMYTVNHAIAEVGMKYYTLSDGDVIRWQFTVWGYGLDLGLDGWAEGIPYYTHADKSELIRKTAADTENGEAKTIALAVIIDPLSTEDDVASALNGFNGETTVHKNALIRTIAEVAALQEDNYTPESWAAIPPALAQANNVAANENATQAQVNAAADALTAAIGGLTLNGAIVERISGLTAADTAVAISKKAYPGVSPSVVLARNDDYMDAMSATGLAGALGAPILLTDRFTLSQAAADEITRLEASTVYIIGGKGAVTEDVRTAVEALGVQTQRVYGLTAADTSVECAKAIEEVDGFHNELDRVIVATSTGFADALSVSSLAYKYHLPIFIVSTMTNDAATDRILTEEAKEMIDNYNSIYVPGGPGALPKSSVEDVFGTYRVKRIWGKTGFDTSDAIAKDLIKEGVLETASVGIANGDDALKGVDALAAASLCGRLSAPIILVSREGMQKSTGLTGYVTDTVGEIKTANVFGGKYPVPETLFDEIKALLKG